MLVFTEVSSINTRWVESSSRCSRIQRRRARATSARSCSLACRTFFKSDAVAHQKTKQRRAAPRYSALVHRRDKLIQRPVPLLLNKLDNLCRVLLQRRAAPATRLGLDRPLVPPRLMPSHRRGDADTEAFRRLIPGRSLVNRFNHSRAQVRRIRSAHGSLTKPNHTPKTPPFRPPWESRFRPNGNRSSVVAAAVPPAETISIPPLPTIVPEARPPEDTTSV